MQVRLLQKLALRPSLMTWIIIIIITRTSCDKSTPAAHRHTPTCSNVHSPTHSHFRQQVRVHLCLWVSCLLGCCHSHCRCPKNAHDATWSVFKDKNAVYPLFSATNWSCVGVWVCLCFHVYMYISTLFGLLSAFERIFVFVHTFLLASV